MSQQSEALEGVTITDSILWWRLLGLTICKLLINQHFVVTQNILLILFRSKQISVVTVVYVASEDGSVLWYV